MSKLFSWRSIATLALWIACFCLYQPDQSLGQDAGNRPNKQPQKKARKKKPQPPFKWVNPIPKGLQKQLPDTVSHRKFKSKSLGTDVGYCIYLPPEYAKPEFQSQRFPVVYYLHGGRPGNECKSVKLTKHIREISAAENIAPMVYVFVNGGPVSHYNMPNDENAQGADIFIKELIPHIDATYRTIANRAGRGIEGFSQGGRGTARLMFRYPELFCSASPGGGGHATEKKISESGGFENEKLKFAEGDNTWDLAKSYSDRLSKESELTPLKILVHVGDKGFNYQNNLAWMKHLASLKIDHSKLIVPGVGHSAAGIYEKNGATIVKFHADNFKQE